MPEGCANALSLQPVRSGLSGAIIGYASVSTLDHNPAMQRDALNDAGCAKLFIEQMSGAIYDRPALKDMLEFARAGDTIVVWKLDRLARSIKQLNETVDTPRLRNIGLRVDFAERFCCRNQTQKSGQNPRLIASAAMASGSTRESGASSRARAP
jgi:DNA invertase Pin-like site-specific DNA recombinase